MTAISQKAQERNFPIFKQLVPQFFGPFETQRNDCNFEDAGLGKREKWICE